MAGHDFVLPRVAGEITISTSFTSRKSIWGWALYDFGNSAFTTLIVTFIYPVLFTQRIVSDGDTGTIIWAYAVSFTAIVVAVTSPFLGAMADRGS